MGGSGAGMRKSCARHGAGRRAMGELLGIVGRCRENGKVVNVKKREKGFWVTIQTTGFPPMKIADLDGARRAKMDGRMRSWGRTHAAGERHHLP